MIVMLVHIILTAMRVQVGSFLSVLIILMLVSCDSKSTSENHEDNHYSSYERNIQNQVRIEVLDAYQNKLMECHGYMISRHEVLAPLPPRDEMLSVRVYAHNEIGLYSVRGYKDVSLEDQLIVYTLGSPNTSYQDSITYGEAPKDLVSSLAWKHNSILLYTDTLQGVDKQYLQYARPAGVALFDSNHAWVGMSVHRRGYSMMMPLQTFDRWLTKDYSEMPVKTWRDLKDEGIDFPAVDQVKGIVLETTHGDIEIKLYDDQAVYKENMIKLCCRQFYDSLLIHRVIPNFLLQTGSPETKFARAGEKVGKDGADYNLPTYIKPRYFHRRGAVAASKPPYLSNPDDETSGSQFYIVSGRVFLEEELDQLSIENKHHFTPYQRKVYATEGGAAHLDGEFAVFGEVVRGMSAVDKITALPIDHNGRPQKDVRILDVKIVYK